MKKNLIIFIVLVIAISVPQILSAKDKKDKEEGYKFTVVKEIETTPVKDQASSGTCWSFAATSFIETEMLRLGKGVVDISEMYFVRIAYPQKAVKYLRYHGLANFSEGGQGHDVTNIISEYGFVPESVYAGLKYDLDYHRHGEIVSVLKGILDNSLKNKMGYTGKSLEILDAALDVYLGEIPEKFEYNSKEYTPVSFANEMGIVSQNYVELTSYTSYPFYEKNDLEIPDNWSHDAYYNVPLEELMLVLDNAFDNGYSVNWDGDMSNKGFSYKNGVAIVPENDPKNMDGSEQLKWAELSEKDQKESLYKFDKPVKEKEVTQELRQKAFDKLQTTDDHLMHLVGVANDQTGAKFYRTKNSWADDSNEMGGYLYMSESYIKLNTIAIQVHVDAIPAEIRAKLGL